MITYNKSHIKLTDKGKRIADYITEKIMYQLVPFLTGFPFDY